MTDTPTNASVSELLPCPFCGSSDAGAVMPPSPHTVSCNTCFAFGPDAETHKGAFTAWNTRSSAAAAPPSVDEVEAVEDFLHELDGWESAYPLSAFPEPDLKKAAQLLKAGGMTLDAISASNMRHVVSCIAPKARAAMSARSPVWEDEARAMIADLDVTARNLARADHRDPAVHVMHRAADLLEKMAGGADK